MATQHSASVYVTNSTDGTAYIKLFLRTAIPIKVSPATLADLRRRPCRPTRVRSSRTSSNSWAGRARVTRPAALTPDIDVSGFAANYATSTTEGSPPLHTLREQMASLQKILKDVE
jgi:hypothetical protein